MRRREAEMLRSERFQITEQVFHPESIIIYWCLLLILGTADIYIAALSFGAYLQDRPVLGLVLAATVAAFTILSAHFIGWWTRRLRPLSQKVVELGVLTAICILLAGFLFVDLATIRETFISQDVTGRTIGVGHDPLRHEGADDLHVTTELPVTGAGRLFYALNCLALLVGAALSLWRHGDPGLESATLEAEKWRHATDALTRKYMNAISRDGVALDQKRKCDDSRVTARDRWNPPCNGGEE
jgi:hypothetical protein